MKENSHICSIKILKSYGLPDKEEKPHRLISRYRYSYCCLMSALASLLGIVNPVLSSFIAQNIKSNFNLKGIIPSLIAMIIVKGTRMYLRGSVSAQLKGGSMRAPIVWLQHRISKRIWWLEPMVNNWGWVGMVITKLTGGVSARTAAFFASMVIDTINALLSGIVYYFTQNYVLSVMTALLIPSFAVLPWFASKSMRYRKLEKIRLR